MKTTHLCPKCESDEIVRIKRGNANWDNSIYTGGFTGRSIPVTRYICIHCGYSEEWIDSPEHLQLIKDKFRDEW